MTAFQELPHKEYSTRDYKVTFENDELPKAFQVECPICCHILTDPCIPNCEGECGYSFCRECIEEKWSPCPMCQTPFTVIVTNRKLGEGLQEMHVYCQNREKGCKWVGELRHLSDHLNPSAWRGLIGCEYTIITCRLCPYKCERKEMANHESLQCPERQYTCEYCQSYTSTFTNVIKHHRPLCELYRRNCAKGATMLNLDSTPSVKDQASTVSIESATLCTMHEENTFEKATKKIKLNEDPIIYTPLPTQSDTIQSEQKQTKRVTGSNYPLVMNNFNRVKSLDGIWWSRPFYTHQKGYLMCLSVKLQGKYMSVYTYILKGEYDKLLKWPLQGEITVKLVDQVHTGSGRNHSRTIAYNRDVGKDCTGRVKEEGKRSEGVGKDNFIAQRSLKPNFLQNNSLLFNVECNVDVYV